MRAWTIYARIGYSEASVACARIPTVRAAGYGVTEACAAPYLMGYSGLRVSLDI